MDSAHFTTLLAEWRDGRKEALDELTPVMYRELHSIAASWLRRERPGHTLEPTALIHEAYLRLVDHKQDEWHSRAHFFSVASHIMRQILAKYARARNTAKRGGGQPPVLLDEAAASAGAPGAAFTALDDALTELERFDPRKSRLIELKYFGGLRGEEIAGVLGISVSTVTRESRLAEAWLQDFLTTT
jgi:RNA polymerase sigma factor (TIGR02999 family)